MAVSQKDNESITTATITTATIITVHEVTYASGTKRVSVLCDDVEEVRGMVDKFLRAGGGAGGAGSGGGAVGGNNDHEPALKITRKAMRRDEFDALEEWESTKP